MRSPSKLSLLDFDIPPAPTPRSIPTVTPRELESLKSGFMSEISSLKATLSGKEAEVASLKTAVGDAERRVGEALEEIRNEAARREAMEIEQAEWDRRGKDMERVLQSVRAELEDGERERDRLTRKADEAERSKEQLEGRAMLVRKAKVIPLEAIVRGYITGKTAHRPPPDHEPHQPHQPHRATSTGQAEPCRWVCQRQQNAHAVIGCRFGYLL